MDEDDKLFEACLAEMQAMMVQRGLDISAYTEARRQVHEANKASAVYSAYLERLDHQVLQ